MTNKNYFRTHEMLILQPNTETFVTYSQVKQFRKNIFYSNCRVWRLDYPRKDGLIPKNIVRKELTQLKLSAVRKDVFWTTTRFEYNKRKNIFYFYFVNPRSTAHRKALTHLMMWILIPAMNIIKMQHSKRSFDVPIIIMLTVAIV